MVVNYKCPGCGAAMIYDEKSDMLVCEYCGTKQKISDVKDEEQNTVENDDTEEAEYASFHGYTCPNCGAEIVTDDTTAATFCSFCGNPTLIEDRLSGIQKPKRIIPFKIGRADAQEQFKKWTRKGLLTPGVFSSQAVVEKITGIYVPFWLYNYDADIELDANATRVRHERRGDWEYVHTDHYLIHRHTFTKFDNVPADASEKMNDEMMDTLEPFDYTQLSGFDMAYLSGYYAEKYTYDAGEMAPRVEKRVRKYGVDATMQTIHGYATVTLMRRNIHLKRTKAEYVLMPVWQLNYTWKDKMYSFVLNGQTGKQVGKRPTSAVRAAVWWVGIAAVSFLVCTLMGV